MTGGFTLKRTLLAGIALGVLAAPAMAADMYVKAPAPYPYLWNGFYAGLNVGYADEQSTFTTAANPTSDLALGVVPGVSEGLAALSSGRITTNSGMGFIGGGQVGYNLQLGNLWVAGLEADIQGKSGTSNGTVAAGAVVVGVPVTSVQTVNASTDWLGTVRGRFGILVSPTWLVYFTGGLAYGGSSGNSTLTQSGSNGFARRRDRQFFEYPHRLHARRRRRMDVCAELERQGRVPLLRSRHHQLLLCGNLGLLLDPGLPDRFEYRAPGREHRAGRRELSLLRRRAGVTMGSVSRP